MHVQTRFKEVLTSRRWHVEITWKVSAEVTLPMGQIDLQTLSPIRVVCRDVHDRVRWIEPIGPRMSTAMSQGCMRRSRNQEKTWLCLCKALYQEARNQEERSR